MSKVFRKRLCIMGVDISSGLYGSTFSGLFRVMRLNKDREVCTTSYQGTGAGIARRYKARWVRNHDISKSVSGRFVDSSMSFIFHTTLICFQKKFLAGLSRCARPCLVCSRKHAAALSFFPSLHLTACTSRAASTSS